MSLQESMENPFQNHEQPEQSELMTSLQWQEIDSSGVIIIDPDGWDRSNLNYSFNKELITKQEYEKRKSNSTCYVPST